MSYDVPKITLNWVQNKSIDDSFTLTDSEDPDFVFTGTLDIDFIDYLGTVLHSCSSSGDSPEISYSNNVFNYAFDDGFNVVGRVTGELVETIGTKRLTRAKIIYNLEKEITAE